MEDDDKILTSEVDRKEGINCAKIITDNFPYNKLVCSSKAKLIR